MAVSKTLMMLLLSIALTFVQTVSSLDPTDTITWGGDVSRSGYQTGHNMDPAIVGSGSFGQIFKTALPGNFGGIGPEQLFSQSLVYTGADGNQYIYIATTQNNIYKLDAKTGKIVSQRNLWVPFLTADLDGCVDINPTVGVTATGVIDPATSIWYFTAKTYSNQFQNTTFGPKNPPGRLNGRYYFHAINTADLTDAAPPTPLEGTIFRNNANRMFISGNQHQRPALLDTGKYIYAGFASHCVKWNFTGAILGFNKQTGAIVEAYAMEGGPESNSIPGGGVWMSGGGLSYDGQGSMYFATGNGYASQLAANGQSVPGRSPPTALEEAAVNAKINDDGTIQIIDFFMPWEKTQLDGADKDLGTSPLELLPASTFSCPNHKRIGVVTGKSGKTYWLNLDDLGGYQNGPNKLDNVIQVFQNENSVYAGAGVMPLGGGYIYINVIQYPSHVFKFSCNSQGNAVFTKVADTNEKCAYTLGVGHGTTTSLNGQDGTGLYWVSDVDGLNLRIYNAIPPTGGNLTLVNSFNIPGVTKFTRPVFGNGRAYIGTTQGFLYGFGSPVSLPLNCSSPYTFPQTPVGNSSAPVTVTCTSLIQTTVNSIALTGNPNFNISSVPSTPLSLNQGQTFSFQAVFSPSTVGPLSSDVVVNTTNGATGYSTRTPITLKGTANSAKPLLAISPNTMSFSTIAGQGTDDQSVLFYNNGDQQLIFQNISYSQSSETGPWITPNMSSDGRIQVGPFLFANVPSSIPANSNAAVTVSYVPTQPGNDAVFVKGFSNGGTALLDVVGVAGSQPSALFEFQTPDMTGWVAYTPGMNFTFGNVTENTTRNLKLRLTNNGSSTAAPLSVTVSKPPYGVPGIAGAANNIDLAEGTKISAGQAMNATLYCSPPKTQVNTPGYTQSVQWTFNTGDPNLGKVFLNFTCNAVSEQLGPLFPNGTAQYAYIGCARDNNPGRQLGNQVYTDSTNNTNGKCTSACYAQGYIFAATEYNSQCWCGNAIPTTFDSDVNGVTCNYQCTGDSRQTCGGNGFYGNTTQMSLFADSTRFNGNTTSAPLAITKSYGNYNYAGCYAETNGKALTAQSYQTSNMTVEYCGSLCKGYSMFGLEYAQQCNCGNSIANGATVTSDSQCSMTCKGSNSEYCGAGNRMQVYSLGFTATTSTTSTVVSSTTSLSSTASGVFGNTTSVVPTTSTVAPTTTTTTTTTTTSATPTSTGNPSVLGGFVYQGCYNEVGGRALQSKSFSNSSNTNNLCASFCSGYTYFATEYSSECYCGNVLNTNSKPVTDGRCSMLCSADSTQICGGANGLSLYMFNANALSSTSSSTVAPTSTSTSTVAPTSTSTSTVAPTSTSTSTVAPTTTSTSTVAPTTTSSSTDAPTTTSTSTVAPTTTSTSTVAVGTTTTTTTTTSTTTSATGTPTPSVLASTGSYGSLGCYNENTSGSGGRVLPNLYANDSMTIQMCAGKAAAANAAFFGVEYGRECWYGATLSSISQPIAQTKCNMLCPGNNLNYCGGGNALQMYNFTVASSTSSSTTLMTSTTTTSVSTTAVPTTTSSTSVAATTTTTSSVAPTSTSTTAVATTSTPTSTSVASTTTTTTTSSTPSTTTTSSTPSTTSTTLSTITTTTTTTTTTAPTPTTTTATSTYVAPVTTITSTAASTTLTTAVSTTVTATVTSMIIPSQTPLSCPQSNGTTWYASSGAQFLIECGIDHRAGDINSTHTNTLEGCIQACDNQSGCVDISMSGTACYMKGKLGQALSAPGILGAKLLQAAGQTTTTVLPTQ